MLAPYLRDYFRLVYTNKATWSVMFGMSHVMSIVVFSEGTGLLGSRGNPDVGPVPDKVLTT